MRYSSVFSKFLSETIFNFNSNSKSRTSNGQSIFRHLAGTPVLNQNRILSPLDRFDVFISFIRHPNHPIGTLFWPQILLVLLVNDSEYSQSTGAKTIFRSLLAVFISFPLARCAPQRFSHRAQKSLSIPPLYKNPCKKK
jgi:hypothetical protein